MAQKSISGLFLRNGVWHIDKQVNGQRLRESCGTSERKEAEKYLIFRLEQIRNQSVYGVKEERFFREAATRYIEEHMDQPSIGLTATYLQQVDPYIGDLPLQKVNDQSLGPYIRDKLSPAPGPDGKTPRAVSNRTVNIALERVIRVLHLCARKWTDEQSRPWLDVVPMISKLDEKKTARKPYPLSWEEQALLFAELPDHLQRMALFKVNTGCREQEVCKLQWDWEIAVPEIGASVFLIPSDFGGRHERSGVKNGDERLVVLNDVATKVLEGQRGLDPTYVFPYGVPSGAVHRMNDSAWKKARVRAAAKWQEKHHKAAHPGFASIRIHDLKHTFGRRLRAAGVSHEDRQALLGHKNGNVTSHYSSVELDQLITAANKVSATDNRAPVLTILRRAKG